MGYVIETGQSTITVEGEGLAPQTDVAVQHTGRSTITITEDAAPPENPAIPPGPVAEIELSMGFGGVVAEHNAALTFQATVLEALALDAMRETGGSVELSLDAAKLAYEALTDEQKAVRFFDARIDELTAELTSTPGCRHMLAKVAAEWPDYGGGPVTLTAAEYAELSMDSPRRAAANASYLEREEWIFNKSLPPR
jgi:hypothetical protein